MVGLLVIPETPVSANFQLEAATMWGSCLYHVQPDVSGCLTYLENLSIDTFLFFLIYTLYFDHVFPFPDSSEILLTSWPFLPNFMFFLFQKNRNKKVLQKQKIKLKKQKTKNENGICLALANYSKAWGLS